MEPLPGPPIRSLDDVTREYVERVIEERPEVPLYRLALEMGISPGTLGRWMRAWSEGESVIKDRR